MDVSEMSKVKSMKWAILKEKAAGGTVTRACSNNIAASPTPLSAEHT